MLDRDQEILSIRVELPNAKVYENTQDLERFQNESLRPIAKFQNMILLEVFKNYIDRYKNVYHKYDLGGKTAYIEQAVKKDSKLKNLIRGLFLGHFTADEYKFYSKNVSAVNKRIINLVKERLLSQIQYFEV
ncbi:glyoxalase [Psychroflexus sp. ALD_RP9]|uniref:glyoxalase n=1 Tax=Psychroflexus sp. ALD_RP9 TaxID=2777186 RepID=UPI001A8D13FB|nr:glyoxalase [Psychroflexus sp. ALD_RP9]QSS97074.1 glyoxalase [Psychroflexus sp. ALD_RP9]